MRATDCSRRPPDAANLLIFKLRIGLFGMDKLMNIDRTVTILDNALQSFRIRRTE